MRPSPLTEATPAADNMLKSALHLVGFRGDEYHSAVRIWGKPNFIHPAWDGWAQQDMHPGDTVILRGGPRGIRWRGSITRTSFRELHFGRLCRLSHPS